jgi:hypothetical protein
MIFFYLEVSDCPLSSISEIYTSISEDIFSNINNAVESELND